MSIYGKTWWGKKWLEAFNGIDDENRLPRGKTYANTGKVLEIKIKENEIKAKVQGSHKYQVSITVNKFTDKEKDIVATVINNSPSILSSLLNKKLPEDLFYELEKYGIKLFPSEWRELKADCTCPDYAMPCKHIAAVIYMIVMEIDKNPFMVFELHGCDLLKIIKNFDFNELCNSKKIITLDSLLAPQSKKQLPNTEILKDISFSNIQNILTYIFALLKPDPVFCDKNFKSVLESMYKFWGRNIDKNNRYSWIGEDAKIRQKKDETPEEFNERLMDIKWNKPRLWKDLVINLDKNYIISNISNGNEDIFIKVPPTSSKIEMLLVFLKGILQYNLYKYNYNVQFLELLSKFALKIIEKSAIIPQIFQLFNGESVVRFIPALFDKATNDVFEKFCLCCPENLLTYEGKNISNKEQVKTILGHMIKSITSYNCPTLLGQSKDNTIFNLFLNGNPSKCGYPENISQWLSNLHLTDRDYKLFLNVEENDNNFIVDLKVSFGDEAPNPISKLLKKNNKLLTDISLIQDFIPQLGKSIDEDRVIEFKLEDFSNFFLNIIPLLRIMGISIILPKSLRNVLKPRLTVDIKAKNKIMKDVKSFLSLDEMVSFDWKVALGEQDISINEFKKLLKESKGLVKLANEFVILDEAELQSLLKSMDKLPKNLDQNELMHTILSSELDGFDVNIDNELQQLIEAITEPKKIDIPNNLNANLRPYQERGFAWLVQNINCGFGSILADDMGLGKTIQTIATILHLKNNNLLNKEKVLIIAPTTLLFNWEREIMKFAPEISISIYHGSKRELEEKSDVVITSYGLLRRDEENLNKKKWFLLIIDEAQNIKNPTTQQTKIVKSIKATHRIALSGTPVENRLFDYWSVFDFTNKNYLYNAEKFKKKFVLPIENERDQNALNVFKKITSPFILRRLKSDKSIISDLPNKIENDCYCTLTPKQTALYQEAINTLFEQIDNAEGIKRKGIVLKLINSLKQICNHPLQFTKKSKNSNDDSGKMQMLLNILQNIDELSEKTIIFTQYVEMGKIMKALIEDKFKTEVMFLSGSLSIKNRNELVNEFQNNSQKRIFIISLKAGGTGLNLTAAKHVIHYDLWWNPAVENQATDRAYRIGQKNNVTVHRFITKGTFEEKINNIIKSKKELSELIVGGGESFVTEMGSKELKELLNLRKVDK